MLTLQIFRKRVTPLILCLVVNTVVQAECYSDAAKSVAPDSRYTILSGGSEVKDNLTGLVWQRCSVGQSWDGNTCSGSALQLNWKSAIDYSNVIGNGYRLPNIKELLSLVEVSCISPAINSNIFPNTQDNKYWTSSPVTNFDDRAWNVNFSYGNNFQREKSFAYYVRAVR